MPAWLSQSNTIDETNKINAISQQPPAQVPQTATPHIPDVNHVIEGTGKPAKKRSKTTIKILLALIVIIVISGLGSSLYIFYNYINNPLILIADSFKNLEGASSFTTKATFAQNQDFGDIEIMLDYHKAPFLLSRGQAKITNIESESGHNLVVLAIFNSTDNYLQASYSKIDSLENQLRLISPEITVLETYQLFRPVIKGQKWLHLKTSEEVGGYQGGEIEISEEQERELNEKFIDSIVVRKLERNYKENGKKYNKIILGFDKEKLIEFIEEVKKLDLEIELKQINSLVKIVQSVDTWDDDLVEILVEKDTGNLYSLTLSLPKIPENALISSIEESVKQQDSIADYYQLFSDKISEYIKPQDSSGLIYIGKAQFTNYNQAPSAQKPTPLVEQEEIENAFQRDFPLILQMILLQLEMSPPDTLGATDSGMPF